MFVGIAVAIIVLILVLYFIYTVYVDYNNSYVTSPWLIPTTRIARQGLVLPGSTIPVSNDGSFGLEFSYSFWLYVNEWNVPGVAGGAGGAGSVLGKHIMNKGSNDGVIPTFQAPGFWLDDTSNKIIVQMNTFASMNEHCSISDVPIGKWVNIILVVINRHMDLYVNGNLKNRCELKGLPRQNYGDVFITQNGGFDGFLSKMRYYNYALPYYKVEQIFNDGPSDAPCTQTGTKPPYLAYDYWVS